MKRGTRYGRIVGRLTLINMVANCCGAVLIAFYFSNLHSGDWRGLASVSGEGLLVAIAGTIGLLVLGNRLSSRWIAPLWAYYSRMAAEGATSEPAPPQVRKIVLNLPAISSGVTLAMWLLAGLFFGVVSAFDLTTRHWHWDRFVQVFVGSEIAGSVTAVLVYFAVERAWRSDLPLFFIGEDLTKVPAFRLGVRTRMLILFIMAVVPLLELAVLSYNQAVQMASAPQPAALLSRLLLLNGFLVGVGVLAAVVLARTLGASIVQPLETLSRCMQAVEQGDLDVRMAVTSNDEIGITAAGFNRMVESLKRREIELRTIYRISQDITASLELDQTLRMVLEQVQQMIACDEAEICLYDTKENILHVRAWSELGQVHVDGEGQIYRLGEGYAGWIGEHRRSLLIADVNARQDVQPDARGAIEGRRISSYLGVPLVAGQNLVGMLALTGARKEMFDEHSQQLLETIAPQASIAIANAVQVQERERLLREQIAQLRIQIDEAKRARQVAEITGTDYFQELQQKVRQMRGEKGEGRTTG